MTDCEKFLVGSRLHSACEGLVEMTLEKVNKLRAHHGIPPMSESVWSSRNGGTAAIRYIPARPIEPAPGVGMRRSCCGGDSQSRPPQHRPPPAARPSLVSRAQNLAMAAMRHLADDNAETPAEPLAFRRRCCATCPQNVDGECRLCGCLLQPNAINNGKLAWRSEQCPIGRWFRHREDRQPFTTEPTRHLIYHIYPKSGAVGSKIWKWNIDQLRQRLPLFNGRKLVAIAHDEHSASALTVRDYFDDKSIEFTEVTNIKSNGEMTTFLRQIEAMQTDDPNAVIFRAHAKGVRHESFFTSTVRPWTEALYVTGLDDWPAIRDALESHIFAGSFKHYGGFREPTGHKWHYAGSFYWYRASRVYSQPNWNHASSERWGCEEWPGLLAKREEAACLLHDFTKSHGPYKEDVWESDQVQQDIDQWTSSRGLPPIIR